MLTTQEPSHVGKGMHAGAYPDDTNTTTGASGVFTSDSVEEQHQDEVPEMDFILNSPEDTSVPIVVEGEGAHVHISSEQVIQESQKDCSPL